MAQKFRFLFFGVCRVMGAWGFVGCNGLFDNPDTGIGGETWEAKYDSYTS